MNATEGADQAPALERGLPVDDPIGRTAESQAAGVEIPSYLLERDFDPGVHDVDVFLEAVLTSDSWRFTAPFRWLSRKLRALPFVRWLSFTTHRMVLRGQSQLVVERGAYRSTGSKPLFRLYSSRMSMPSGWVEIRFDTGSESTGLQPVLTATDDNAHHYSYNLPRRRRSRYRRLILMPERVGALYLRPTRHPGRFALTNFTIRECGGLELALRVVGRLVKATMRRPRSAPTHLRAAISSYRVGGKRGLLHTVLSDPTANEAVDEYQSWIELYSSVDPEELQHMAARIERFRNRPLVSVLMPVFDPPENLLVEALDSVLAQVYENWELCIADDASTKPKVRRILADYARRDRRIKVVYRQHNGGIAAASNSALELVDGEFVALFDQDDLLAPHALYMVVDELQRHPKTDWIYSDEDKVDARGRRFSPYFKPDWSPDLLYSQNYINHLGVYRAQLLRQLGGFREKYEGSQDYDLLLRFSRITSRDRIRHIPHILYHWRAIATSVAASSTAKSYAIKSARKAIQEHVREIGAQATVAPAKLLHYHRIQWAVPSPEPLVSVVVPTRDRPDLLAPCAKGILKRTDYPNLELVVLDNQSKEDESYELFARLEKDPRVRILRYDKPFNYASINNWGVGQARGKVITLLNNDTEVIAESWLTEMVSQACRPEVGMVGAKLYYPSGRIQQAGVLLGPGGVAVHLYSNAPGNSPGYFGRAELIQNLSAVTAACTCFRKEVFEEVGGFDEGLAVAFNDVDLCIRVRDSGYWIVWTPYAELFHHESVSVGRHNSPERRTLFADEVNTMKDRYGALLLEDPYHNPNLSLEPGREFELSFPPRISPPWNEPIKNPDQQPLAAVGGASGGKVTG